jgi:hypothetical protein
MIRLRITFAAEKIAMRLERKQQAERVRDDQ